MPCLLLFTATGVCVCVCDAHSCTINCKIVLCEDVSSHDLKQVANKSNKKCTSDELRIRTRAAAAQCESAQRSSVASSFFSTSHLSLCNDARRLTSPLT